MVPKDIFDFPKWLSTELKIRGWKHKDLAEKTGISSMMITHYLQGMRLPSMRTFFVILEAFDMHMLILNNH